MGPTWTLLAPVGSHIGPMSFAIREILQGHVIFVHHESQPHQNSNIICSLSSYVMWNSSHETELSWAHQAFCFLNKQPVSCEYLFSSVLNLMIQLGINLRVSQQLCCHDLGKLLLGQIIIVHIRMPYTLWCHYNAVNFLPYVHKRHPISGCSVFCGSSIWLIFCLNFCNHLCNILQYLYLITVAHDCTYFHKIQMMSAWGVFEICPWIWDHHKQYMYNSTVGTHGSQTKQFQLNTMGNL